MNSTPTPDRNRLFAGQAAMVTGAGSGLGRATARLLAEAGAAVVVLSRDAQEVERVVAEITGAGGRAVGLAADVSDPATPGRAVRLAVQTFGGLHVLVNNAAYFERINTLETPYSAWERMFAVLFGAAVRLSQAAAREMIRAGIAGRIVNVSSVEARYVDPGAPHYGSAKAALEQVTRALAVEFAANGLLVNAVAPGFMDTPMAVVNGRNELEDKDYLEWYVRRRKIPLARAARPEEVAEAILFLASPLNTYITGEVLTADGGLTCTF
jgi:NAD(P)-dependent dehydrogenase (short-subunit alcohol dehydrogenase family)